MNNINDDQRWVYPHRHPWFPQNQYNRFMPFLGRPMGDESYRHATVLSFLGRGPKGAKGDTFTYDDMTPADKANLVRYLAGATGSIEEYSFTSNSDLDSYDVQDMDVDPAVDILFVYVNGIMLSTSEYRVENGNHIVFTNGVQYNGLQNEFLIRILRFEASSPESQNTENMLNFLNIDRDALIRGLGE